MSNIARLVELCFALAMSFERKRPHRQPQQKHRIPCKIGEDVRAQLR